MVGEERIVMGVVGVGVERVQHVEFIKEQHDAFLVRSFYG